jgi:thymidylate synthase
MIENLVKDPRSTVFDSLDEIQAATLSLLLSAGQSTTPRRLPTREVLGVAFCLSNARKRCVTIPARRWSLPLAIGEFCWHASASTSVEALAFYSKRWREFADDQATIRGSCYGRAVFEKGNDGVSQWQHVVELLRIDPDSRRALILLASPASVANKLAKDVACATAIQFVVRNRSLSAIVSMRSNDVLWGLPYDVFFFTMLQELLAVTLGLDLGTYYHSVGSLHLYDRHLELAHRVLTDEGGFPFEMPTMKAVDQLREFLDTEAALRHGQSPLRIEKRMDPYWKQLVEVLSWFGQRKQGASNWNDIEGSMYLPLLRNLSVW